MRYVKMAGVTLLEIMLVLAVAAMVIVMSIKYYQSAQISQQSNNALGLVQAITAAADNLSLGTGGYSAVSTAAISQLIGGASTPQGGSIKVTPGSNEYKVEMDLKNSSVCKVVAAQVKANKKVTSSSCSAAGVLTYQVKYQ